MTRKQNAIADRTYRKVVVSTQNQVSAEQLQSIRLDNRMKSLDLVNYSKLMSSDLRHKANEYYYNSLIT